ncbi:hypothetical protein [Hymenobacter coccineus]|uniref:YcxB-like protein domain-containing protein n=1 Tax=Hymenobacter coccineus TaxID=1908235 RepID=A0A1G1TE39_9BACT|nr:hypothetical protein [Hymenobacter coccineus]OGX89125.1 hypothetical protein BEN49_09665 [Hymenobacter coccineus]
MINKAFPTEAPGVLISADEYVAVNLRLWWRAPATRRNHWLLGGALVLLAISVGAQLLGRAPDGSFAWSSPVLLAVGLAYGAARLLLVRRLLRRTYFGSAAMQVPVDYELTEAALCGQSKLGRFDLPWSSLRRAVWVRPNWLLLYPAEAACYYLDLRCLPATTPPAAVAALLTQHNLPQAEA